MIADGLRGSGERGAVETLFGLLSDHSIETAIVEALGEERKLRHVLADRDAAKRSLRALLGGRVRQHSRAVDPRDRRWQANFRSRCGRSFSRSCRPTRARPSRLDFVDAALIGCSDQMVDGEERFDAFLKDGARAPTGPAHGKIRDAALAEAVGREHDRLAALPA